MRLITLRSCVCVFHVVVDARLIDGIDAHLSAGVQDAVVLQQNALDDAAFFV